MNKSLVLAALIAAADDDFVFPIAAIVGEYALNRLIAPAITTNGLQSRGDIFDDKLDAQVLCDLLAFDDARR